jgi:hypothetical protein
VAVDMDKSNWVNEGMRQSGWLKLILSLSVLFCFSASLAKAEECDLSTKWFQVYDPTWLTDERAISKSEICDRYLQVQKVLMSELGKKSTFGKCSKLSIRHEEGKEEFILTVDSSGAYKDHEQLRNNLISKIYIELNVNQFRKTKTYEELCTHSETDANEDQEDIRKTVDHNAGSYEKNIQETSLEATFISTTYQAEVTLEQLKDQYKIFFNNEPQDVRDESDESFAINVIREVQRKIGAAADGIWGSGSKRALVRWIEANPSVFGEEDNSEALNLLKKTSQTLITKANLAKLSETFAKVANLIDPDERSAATGRDAASRASAENEQLETVAKTTDAQMVKSIEATTENPAELKAEIEGLMQELRQKEIEISKQDLEANSLNSLLKEIETAYDKLESKYNDLLEKPVLSNLLIRGSFDGKDEKIDKSKIKIDQHCWNPNQSLNDNLEDITKENCLEYDDGSYEALPDGHTYIAEKQLFTIALQPSFAKTISSIILEVGEQIPDKEIPYCQVLVEIAASDGSTFKVPFYPNSNGFLEISRKDFEAASDAPTEWQTAKLLLRTIEDDLNPCALVNPSNNIIIQKEPNQNSALIERDGSVTISANVAPLKLLAKPLTVILSTNTGAEIDEGGKKKPDPVYAFSVSQDLQLPYFEAFAKALEEFLNDDNSKFGEVSIYISTENSYEQIYPSRGENIGLIPSVLDGVSQGAISAKHPDIGRFLKKLKQEKNLGIVLTFGSKGTLNGFHCSPSIRKWTKELKEDKFIDVDIMPFKKFDEKNTKFLTDTSLYQCDANQSQYVLVEKNKYRDEDGVNEMASFLLKLFQTLNEE